MLVLTRNVGETIVIGNEVRVKVLSIKGNQTRLGIIAPDNVSIHREEVYLRILEEGKDSDSMQDMDREDR